MKNLFKSFEYKIRFNNRGFTLIELLIVIGIIAVLLAMAVVAISPGEQFAKANNVRRTHDLKQILSAIQQNMIDNKGPFLCADIPVCNPDGSGKIMGSDTGAGQYDICSCLVPNYLPQMPVDPQGGIWGGDCSNYNTQYEICSGSLKLRAPKTQMISGIQSEIINVTLPGTFTVQAPTWDFTILVNPNLGSVIQGNSISATVNTNLVSGTSQYINFSASGLPTNATVSFSPTNCKPTCSSTMTINTVSTTPAGNYQITITGTGGGKTKTVTYNLTVTTSITEYPVWQSCEAGSLSGPSNYDYSMGYKFTPTVNGQVTKLCGFFQGTKWVRLYDSAPTPTVRRSIQVPGNAPASWVCASILPFNITTGSVYYVVAEIAGSGGYVRGTFMSPINLPMTCNTVTINASVYQSPSGTFNASHTEGTFSMYGMVDIIFTY